MIVPTRVREFLTYLFRRSQVEDDMHEEFLSHLRNRADDLERQGLSRPEAERHARVDFGAYQRYKEECREALGSRLLGELVADVRYGLRQLRRNPGFTVVAVLTLALGIGVNSAVFSLVDEVWFRPRPVAHPERVVRIYASTPTSEGANPHGQSSYLDYQTIRAGVESFSGVAFLQMRGAMLDANDERKLLDVAVVSDGFFDVLEPRAAAGHVVTAAEAGAPGTRTVMLSYPFWNDQFSADRTLPGKTIVLDHQSVVVAGVLPRGFRGADPVAIPAIWIPMSTWSELTGERPTAATGWSNPSDLFGRLRLDATLAQANAELAVIAARLGREHPETNAERTMMAVRESRVQGEGVRGFSLILLAIGALVLLIACANVASLLLARAEGRRREFAMRAALGASRRRLLRQLLTEATLLGGAAIAGALLIGRWVDAVLPNLLPPLDLGAATPVDAHMTARVLWFSVAAGLVAVFAFGTIPAIKGSRNAPAGTLNERGRGGTPRASVRSVFVVAQVAISLMLVVAAGLLVRSLLNAEAANPGFDAHQNMLVYDFGADFKTPEAYRAFIDEARRRIARLPGVLGTAVAMRIPFGLSGGGFTRKVFFAGATGRAATDGIPVGSDPVSNDFFRIMGTRILQGRGIDAHDLQANAHVIVIDQTMARRFWPNGNAVGDYVHLDKPDGPRHEVIGIAEDSKNEEFIEAPAPYLYTPMGLGDYGELEMVVKTAPNPSSAAGLVRQTLTGLDPGLTIVYSNTLRQHVRLAMASERLSAELVASLGALGLLLAAVGLYGVTSYLVRSRTREIGIRMALGATRTSVLRLVMSRALLLTCIGLAIGVAGALGATGLLRALLFGVAPHNALVFTAGMVVLALAASAASLLPALRATRVNPTEALRYD